MPAGFRASSEVLRVMNKAEAVLAVTVTEGAEGETRKQILSKYSHTRLCNDKLRYAAKEKHRALPERVPDARFQLGGAGDGEDLSEDGTRVPRSKGRREIGQGKEGAVGGEGALDVKEA